MVSACFLQTLRLHGSHCMQQNFSALHITPTCRTGSSGSRGGLLEPVKTNTAGFLTENSSWLTPHIGEVLGDVLHICNSMLYRSTLPNPAMQHNLIYRYRATQHDVVNYTRVQLLYVDIHIGYQLLCVAMSYHLYCFKRVGKSTASFQLLEPPPPCWLGKQLSCCLRDHAPRNRGGGIGKGRRANFCTTYLRTSSQQ